MRHGTGKLAPSEMRSKKWWMMKRRAQAGVSLI